MAEKRDSKVEEIATIVDQLDQVYEGMVRISSQFEQQEAKFESLLETESAEEADGWRNALVKRLPTPDVAGLRRQIVDMLTLLAAPAELEKFCAEGILEATEDGWFKVSGLKQLPPHLLARVKEWKHKDVDGTVIEILVTFRDTERDAAELLKTIDPKYLR
jgi:hypothetical protein